MLAVRKRVPDVVPVVATRIFEGDYEGDFLSTPDFFHHLRYVSQATAFVFTRNECDLLQLIVSRQEWKELFPTLIRPDVHAQGCILERVVLRKSI
ncbi:hypothetical protein MRX96_053322 [Rhipicephalus microplus]